MTEPLPDPPSLPPEAPPAPPPKKDRAARRKMLDAMERLAPLARPGEKPHQTLVRVVELARSAEQNGVRGLRRVLPTRRTGYTQKFKIAGQSVFLRTGEYPDGVLGEVFIDVHKEGAGFRTIMACFARSISIALQYGVPLEEYVASFVGTSFEPQGDVDGHPKIRRALSTVDAIFRELGIEYLGREELAVLPPELPEPPRGGDPA